MCREVWASPRPLLGAAQREREMGREERDGERREGGKEREKYRRIEEI